MAKVEWSESANPTKMLNWLRDNFKLSDRKQRLLSCACCRQVWSQLPKGSRWAVDVAEGYADELEDVPTLEEARRKAGAAHRAIGVYNNASSVTDAVWMLTRRHVSAGVQSVPDLVLLVTHFSLYDSPGGEKGVRRKQGIQRMVARTIIEIVGHAPHPPALDPSWRTPSVVNLADAIYLSKDFDGMLILGDALEEAGCTSDEVLQHCRGAGPHYRGCWLLDWILQKD